MPVRRQISEFVVLDASIETQHDQIHRLLNVIETTHANILHWLLSSGDTWWSRSPKPPTDDNRYEQRWLDAHAFMLAYQDQRGFYSNILSQGNERLTMVEHHYCSSIDACRNWSLIVRFGRIESRSIGVLCTTAVFRAASSSFQS